MIGQQNVVPGGAPQPRGIANGPQMPATTPAAAPQPRGPSAQAPPTYKYPSQAMRTPVQGMQPQQNQPSSVVIQGQEPLSASALAAAHPNDQKQMLGERLFPLIHVSFSAHTFLNCCSRRVETIISSNDLIRRSTQLWLEKSLECCSKWTILRFCTCWRTGIC